MKIRFAALLCASIALPSVSSAKPFLNDGRPFQITKVEVEQYKAFRSTANFPEEVRQRTQNLAYRFSEKGDEKTLRVLLRILTVPGPGRALTTSGSSSVKATVTLIDKKTGIHHMRFKAWGRIFRPGWILGAAENAIVGRDHVADEKRVAKLLAGRMLKVIYGKEYWEKIKDRRSAQMSPPRYPMNWQEAYRKFDCELRREAAAKGGSWAAEDEEASPEDYARKMAELKTTCARYLTARDAAGDTKFQIVDVQVEAHELYRGTANMPEEVRAQLQNAAYKFSEQGREKRLRIILRPGSKKIYDSSRIRITANIIDKPTGRVGQRYKVKVKLGAQGKGEAPDPGGVQRTRNERLIARDIARQLLPKIYGKDYTRSVIYRRAGQKTEPAYPMSWEEAGRRFRK